MGLQSPSSPRVCTQHANTIDNTIIMTIDDTHISQTEHAKSGIVYEYEDFSKPCCLYYIIGLLLLTHTQFCRVMCRPFTQPVNTPLAEPTDRSPDSFMFAGVINTHCH